MVFSHQVWLVDDLLAEFSVSSDSDVLVDDLLSHTSIFNIYRGHMPSRKEVGERQIITVIVYQLIDPHSPESRQVRICLGHQ